MCVGVCVCLYVCGWSCTLYDGLLWLHKRPSLITSALDLVVWVCVQGNCCRCIFMLYCAHGHHGVIVLIHVTWVTLVSPCMRHLSTCLMLWRVSACHSTSMSIRAIAHQMQNSTKFLQWKWGIPIAVFSHQKLGENRLWCAIMHPRRSAARFPPWK